MPSPLATLFAVGAGPPSLLTILLLGGVGVLLWLREHPPQDTLTDRGDAPARLSQWANGLLPSDRTEWGQAMLGELDRIEGRSARWRFALGCVAGVVLLPPWGPLGPMAAFVAVGLGSAAVLGFGFVHFGLAADPSNWVMLAILAAFVAGSIVGLSVLLRRPRVAGPGLIGGLFVAAVWLAFSGLTFAGMVSPIHSMGDWSNPTLYIAVPLVVGVGSAWRSESVLVGRRAARLAGMSAGLIMFLLSSIAVVAIDGGPRDPGVGVAGGVSEAFSNVTMLFLVSLPLATAAIGWIAATVTPRVRSLVVVPHHDSKNATGAAGRVAVRNQSRSTGRVLLCVAAVVVGVLAVVLLIQIR